MTRVIFYFSTSFANRSINKLYPNSNPSLLSNKLLLLFSKILSFSASKSPCSFVDSSTIFIIYNERNTWSISFACFSLQLVIHVSARNEDTRNNRARWVISLMANYCKFVPRVNVPSPIYNVLTSGWWIPMKNLPSVEKCRRISQVILKLNAN